ncbi:MAG: FAD-binding oxidoreductase [Gemmatimonadales bacterium]
MSIVPTTDQSVRESYSRDASGLELVPEMVARPESAAEAAALIAEAISTGTSITTAGGQTSLTGASITDRGMLLSLRAMARMVDIDVAARTVRVEPGGFVGDMKRAVAEHGLLFPPDITSENEATIGGAIACNSSGARSLRYGPTRRWVRALTVALATGEVVELQRPRLEKNTAGYRPMHDPVDWFIGSEGTLGVVLEAVFDLLPLPEQVTGLGVPFANEADALRFVREARRHGIVTPRCLEYLDDRALEIVHLQEGGEAWRGAAFVYTEQEHRGDDDAHLDAWLELAEASNAAVDDIVVFDSDAAIRGARDLRHAVPATTNEQGSRYIAQGGRRVATDWAVPLDLLPQALTSAREIAAKHDLPRPVTFGHAGNGHPHMDFVAADAAELARVEAAVEETLHLVLGMGGTVAAEHGIGKLKKQWLPLQVSPMQLAAMSALKKTLDPAGLLAPGNVIS